MHCEFELVRKVDSLVYGCGPRNVKSELTKTIFPMIDFTIQSTMASNDAPKIYLSNYFLFFQITIWYRIFPQHADTYYLNLKNECNT